MTLQIPSLSGFEGIRSGLRAEPSFLIIGSQKAGTTSLFNYLLKHPCVLGPTQKEVHYFSDNFLKGRSWYQNHFPPLTAVYRRAVKTGRRPVTGEASPYYIFHPCAPERVHSTLPKAKIIVMLRNPVDRAYSHYKYHVKLGAEDLAFEDALNVEEERLAGEDEKLIADDSYFSFNHKMFSYQSRGRYIEQLKRWARYYSVGDMLIVRSEDFFEDSESIFADVLRFLGLPEHRLPEYQKFNAGGGDRMNPETRARLLDYFAPYNKRLYQFLGREMGW